MTVGENVEYGLPIAKVGREERRRSGTVALARGRGRRRGRTRLAPADAPGERC
jgi:hypothetical protein